MPAEHDLDPDAMTDEERRAKRRYHAYFTFETLPCDCVSGHLGWDGQPATYIDIDGVTRCRRCQRPKEANDSDPNERQG